MTANLELASPTQNTYDEVPYESYPYALTNPYHLNTLATLFGMKASAVETAGILELFFSELFFNMLPRTIILFE